MVGAALGLLVTWWAAEFMQALLFEVDARDPWTYALVATVLIATAGVAAWLPARRAARTDPAIVLRAVDAARAETAMTTESRQSQFSRKTATR